MRENAYASQGEFLSSPAASTSWVDREHLQRRLNQALNHPLTLIIAPPGYGKSLLVRDWLQSCHQPAVWMPLHSRDNDALGFWSRFEQQLHDALPELRLRSSLARQDSPYSGETDADSIRERLHAQLVRLGRGWQAPDHVIWVLDDLQKITNPQILKGLNAWLDRCPPRLHLVITSRTQPDLEIGRRRVAQQVLEMGVEDLKFDERDCEQFFRKGLNLPLNAEQCRYLMLKTEGWPAALQLAGRALTQGKDIAATLQQLVGQQGPLSDYLFEEVYSRQSPAIRNLLSHASHLPWFNGSLLDAVRQSDDSADILAQLSRSEALIQALDVPAGAFRLHDLFRDWLRQHPLTETTAEELGGRASDWLARQGYTIAALDLLLNAESWESIDGLLADQLEKCLLQGQTAAMLGRLRQIPASVLEQYAWLRLARALNSFREGRFSEADAALQSLTGNSEPDPRVGLVALFCRSQIAHYSGNPEVTCQLLEAIEQHPGFKDSPLGPWVRQTLAVNHLFGGEVQVAKKALAACARESEQLGDLYGLAVSISWLVPCLLFTGNVPQAWRWINHLETALSSEESASALRALIPSLKAGLLRESNQLAEAEQALAEALELGIAQLSPIDQTYHRLQSWNLALNQGRLDRARELVEDLRFDQDQSGRPWHTLYPEPEVLESIQELVEGQPGPLVQWSLSLTWEDIRGGILQNIGTRLLWIRARLALQQDCAQALEDLESWAQKEDLPYFRIRIGLTRAMDAHSRLQDDDEARHYMLSVLSLSRRFGYTRVLLDEGPDLLALLSLCDGHPDYQEEIRRLRHHLQVSSEASLETAPATTTTAPTHAEGTDFPETLSDRESELLQLLSEGFSNRELAEKLGIALPTVKTHLRNIYSKLGAGSRTQALALARQRGWVV